MVVLPEDHTVEVVRCVDLERRKYVNAPSSTSFFDSEVLDKTPPRVDVLWLNKLWYFQGRFQGFSQKGVQNSQRRRGGASKFVDEVGGEHVRMPRFDLQQKRLGAYWTFELGQVVALSDKGFVQQVPPGRKLNQLAISERVQSGHVRFIVIVVDDSFLFVRVFSGVIIDHSRRAAMGSLRNRKVL